MTNQAQKEFVSLFSHIRYENLVAGIAGGVISTLTLHPLDLVKVRLAVSDGLHTRPKYSGMIHAFRAIVRETGFLSLYQGAAPNVLGAGASWGFYFLFYGAIKAYMQDSRNEPLGPERHILAAATSGVITLFITNPIWVVKTRLILQYEGLRKLHGDVKVKPKRYKGLVDAFVKIYKFEGIPGLYKGLIPGLFGVSHGALQFMAYEELKKLYNNYYEQSNETQLGASAYITFAALSKLFAVSVTYPYQVVRARLQDQHRHYDSVMDCVKRTWKHEHARGFYKGLIPNLIRVTPATCITFVVYEKIKYVMMPPKLPS